MFTDFGASLLAVSNRFLAILAALTDAQSRTASRLCLYNLHVLYKPILKSINMQDLSVK